MNPEEQDNQENPEESDSMNPEEEAHETAVFNINSTKAKEDKTDYGLVRQRILEEEMQESYLDYAMSVIIARALPDVRDGLKPVHRRVLYAMWETGLKSAVKYRKCAAVVGEVLKSYHPHGDIAVYDTLVRMAQDFNMRAPLIDGQGNFGSLDGDSPAAMRYTEARMSQIAEELLIDIDKNTVNFSPNYDATKFEPKVLPAKLPNLLLNGSMGIAVGMATNIPPHNLGEVSQAIRHLIDCPDCTIDDLMQYIKGPDFPTGAEIYGLEQIKAAYTSGKGAIVMRAVARIEESKRGHRIIISEIPYQVNKGELVAKIAELVKLKKIEGINDLRDESDRKEKVRIVIELRANAYPKKVLNRLYELTSLQASFYTNMLALVDGIQPRVLTLKNILEEYLKHRKEVIRRRSQYELDRAKERAHILEGLKIALKSIDDVVSLIRKSKDREEAGKLLKTKFKLTDQQTAAILEMRLASLAALEREKVETEHQEKLKAIARLTAILASEQKILEIIKKELKEIEEKYPSPRRTKIYPESLGKFSAEDLIPSEQVIILLTRGNYIKRMPDSAYRSQVRGGKGVIGMETKEEDMIEHLVIANTHDDIFFFTDRGRIFHTKVYEIASVSRLSKGQAIVNILQISPEEKVTAMITISQKDKEKYQYFVLATARGLVKKTDLKLYAKVRQTGILAIKLKSDDRLRWVKATTGQDSVFQVSAKGQSILYHEGDIRPMGRTAAGVRGILLKGEDYVVATDVLQPEQVSEADALIVLEKGFGKRTPLKFFKTQLRGGMGMRAASVTPRTGEIVGMRLTFGKDYDLILASQKGQMIRMALSSVKKLQRDTQGVIVVRLNKGDKVTSVTVISKGEDDQSDNLLTPTSASTTTPAPKIDTDVEVKPQAAGKSEKPKTEGQLPDWAKAHRDALLKPKKLTKPKMEIMPTGKDKESTQEEKSSKPKKDSDEPNYWGGRLL
ncbi:MAG TPA: DNA gyrase subunit A [Patescibacteria group bacterium]|nr:DNA gyrase subunit A [Patescibacteria group bacterium]